MQRHVSESSKDKSSPKASQEEKSSEEGSQAKSPGRTPAGAVKKEGKCRALLRKIGYFSLIFIIPAILNYAALSQESRALVPNG